MTANGKALRTALEAYFAKHSEILGSSKSDINFYSQEEWNARGEILSVGSPFIITFEGYFYEVINYGSSPALEQEFRSIVKEHGFYGEQGNAWNMGFYS
jgi:hypothetical protein